MLDSRVCAVQQGPGVLGFRTFWGGGSVRVLWVFRVCACLGFRFCALCGMGSGVPGCKSLLGFGVGGIAN